MSRLTRLAAAAGAAAVLALGVLIPVLATTASAQSVLFTATTAITADGAVSYPVLAVGPPITFNPGHSPWAIDNYTRSVTVYTADSDVCVNAGLPFTPGTDQCYTANVADAGTFTTVPDAYEPDQSLNPDGDLLPSNVISGTFSGTADYVFVTTSSDQPASTNVPATLNGGSTPDDTGTVQTQDWWQRTLATPGVAGQLNNDWTWTYKTGCETWTDAYVNNRGQSTPVTADGDITDASIAATCATPAPTPTATATTPAPAPTVLYGDYVNPFGNGFDVRQQHAAVNTQIIGWPATQHDPATHFLYEPEGTDFRLEYAPAGGGDGLCVSNPGDGLLVLRGCNANIWQKFSLSGKNIVSAANGEIVNPDGRGAQLSTGSAAVSWGGANYTWTAFASLPA